MSRCRIIAIAIIALTVESLCAAQARADGGEALLERLLDTPPAQTATTTTTQTTAPGPAIGTLSAARAAPRDAIRLTPDRTEVVRLEQDAASVVVTNPAHAQVMMETPRLLLIMPRQPGSTSLFVLDKDGNSILERDIIISGASKPYVRIRKSCSGSDRGCVADSYFYCPDGCYEVGTVPPSASTDQPALPSSPLVIDSAPVPGDIPPNAQGRTEPEPLPDMQEPSGLDTDELDTAAPVTGEEENPQ